MYNIPMRTGCAIEPETVSRLAKDFSNIRGVKDSSGKFENILAYIHGTDPEHFSGPFRQRCADPENAAEWR